MQTGFAHTIQRSKMRIKPLWFGSFLEAIYHATEEEAALELASRTVHLSSPSLGLFKQ